MNQNTEKLSFQQLNAEVGTKPSFDTTCKKIEGAKPLGMQDKKQGQLPSPIADLDTLHEKGEDNDKSISSSGSSRDIMEELIGGDYMSDEEVKCLLCGCIHVFS